MPVGLDANWYEVEITGTGDDGGIIGRVKRKIKKSLHKHKWEDLEVLKEYDVHFGITIKLTTPIECCKCKKKITRCSKCKQIKCGCGVG